MFLWDHRYVRAARNQFRPTREKARVLKHRLRNILRHVKHRITNASPLINDAVGEAVAALKMKYIDNIQELDRVLENVHDRFAVSDDEGRKALSEFCYVADHNLPADPYSQEYYDAQMHLYRQISGRKTYAIENEHSAIDVEAAKNTPFPYYTASPSTVGDQLIAQGFLIQIGRAHV